MRWHRIAIVFAVAPFAASCGGTANPPPAAVTPAVDSQTIQVVPAQTAPTLPRGVAARDGSALYAVSVAGGRTTIRAFDPASGATLRSDTLAGAWELPVVTADGALEGLSFGGGWLALQGPHGPKQSQFAVLDTALGDPPQIVKLKGDYTFDAISRDGSKLFLTHHLRATHYTVMLYDLAFEDLEGPLVDKRFPNEKMEGYAMTRATSPDGSWIYTLYQEDAHHAFIHAIATEGATFCIDLPALARGGAAIERSWTLSAPDYETLLVRNRLAGLRATVNMEKLTVRVES
jgi:hypothetical protein